MQGRTLCVERKINFDDVTVEAKYCLKVSVDNIARESVHDDDFGILPVVGVVHVHISIVERLWRRRAASVRHQSPKGKQVCDSVTTLSRFTNRVHRT